MKILGIACRSHDAGIALLANGQPLFVLEEERFNRDKHTKLFPIQSLEAAFKASGLGIGDISTVTIPWDTRQLRHSFAKGRNAGQPLGVGQVRISGQRLTGMVTH